MYRHYKLPYDYGWLAMGAAGSGGGASARYFGPPLDYFFNSIWWLALIASLIATMLIPTACR